MSEQLLKNEHGDWTDKQHRDRRMSHAERSEGTNQRYQSCLAERVKENNCVSAREKRESNSELRNKEDQSTEGRLRIEEEADVFNADPFHSTITFELRVNERFLILIVIFIVKLPRWSCMKRKNRYGWIR